MILKMRRSQVLRVVNTQTLSVRLHDVARKAEFSALCVFRSLEVPIPKQRNGNAKSARNAVIFPPRVEVICGRKTKTATNATLNAINSKIKNAGIYFAMLRM